MNRWLAARESQIQPSQHMDPCLFVVVSSRRLWLWALVWWQRSVNAWSSETCSFFNGDKSCFHFAVVSPHSDHTQEASAGAPWLKVNLLSVWPPWPALLVIFFRVFDPCACQDGRAVEGAVFRSQASCGFQSYFWQCDLLGGSVEEHNGPESVIIVRQVSSRKIQI